MKNLIRIGVVAAVAGLASSAQAAELTYIFTGLGIGQIGDLDFDDVPFTVRVTGDTASIFGIGPAVYGITPMTATIEVAGITADITTPVYVFVNQFNNLEQSVVGLSRDGGGTDIFDVINPLFQPYDLSTTFPLTAGSLLVGDFSGIDTSAGPLNMDMSLNEGTFEVIPTPGAGALALIAGIASLRRRRA